MAHPVLNNSMYMKGLISGYDNLENSQRVNKDQKFHIWWNAPKQLESLVDASVRAAREARAATNKEIIVLYSGGVDSEWVLESFRRANIQVTPLVVVYEDDLNAHDLFWARRYLDRHNYNAIWHRVNLRQWYDSPDILEMAAKVQTPELAYTAQFKSILDHHNGSRVFVTGYDEPQIVADDSDGKRKWTLTYMERHYSVCKFFIQYQVPGISWGGFSPELFASYVFHPQWQMLMANMYNPLVWNSESVKPQMMNYSFQLEQRPKFTGFEEALDIVVNKSQEWQAQCMRDLGFNWTSSWEQDLRDTWRSLGVAI